MSELVVPPKDISHELRGYGRLASEFANSKSIPRDLLRAPDHTLIKTPTPADFQDRYTQIKDWTDRRYFLEVQGRFLIAAKLIVPMALSDQRVSWIEVMESKSPEGTTDYLGAEYTEFLYPNYNQASIILTRSRVTHVHMEDDHHRWINVSLDREGRELRITDRPLEATIDAQVDSGIARPIAD